MLDQIREDLVEHYCDPRFRGVDLDAPDRSRAPADRRRAVARRDLRASWPASASTSGLPHHVPTAARVQEVHYGWSWQLRRRSGPRRLRSTTAATPGRRACGSATPSWRSRASADAGHSPDHPYLLHQLRPQPQLVVTVERDGARRTLTLPAKFRKQPQRASISTTSWTATSSGCGGLRGSGGREAEAASGSRDGVLYWRMTDFFRNVVQFEFAGESSARRGSSSSTCAAIPAAGSVCSASSPASSPRGHADC